MYRKGARQYYAINSANNKQFAQRGAEHIAELRSQCAPLLATFSSAVIKP